MEQVCDVGIVQVGFHVVGSFWSEPFSMENGSAQKHESLIHHSYWRWACPFRAVADLVQCSVCLCDQCGHIDSIALANFHKQCLAKMLLF